MVITFPFIVTSSATKEPPVMAPVDVIVEEPVLIVPKADVIEPESKAPVVTIPLPPTELASK